MSTTDLENIIATKTRDAAPPKPLLVEVWVTWASGERTSERAYDLYDATQSLDLGMKLRSYALAGVKVEILPVMGGGK